MFPPGFFGTRADVLMDLVLVVFIVLPGLMHWAVRLVRKGRHRSHRNFQVVSVVAILAAVVLFEVDVRVSGGSATLLGPSPLWQSGFLKPFLIVHVLIAVTTFLAWLILDIRSWRRFGGGSFELPGGFSPTHRRWGKSIVVGVWLTSLTGIGLYVMGFAL